ncbi:hypothetical protein DL766_003594 [Monosporascus sp. MC13-8B]|uniref:CN hydrolase domain-containing protein n=1 Tax=Monosporascus cannonballus TaxID=155416 RepID=A0ABY0GRZ1_9PEZI|nr:hypothetical protein DL762_009944 [Monosporascus cannonballus]RYP33214.1 hypothetical protein DL766_003594 [Monosporascus sp. MC13-8B]
MAPPKIRLATASPGTQATTKETLAQLHQIAKRAAANRADILLLPEAYIGGYPRGADFGCKVGARTAEGREEYLQYFKSAVDLGDTVGDGAGAGDAWLKRRLPGQLTSADDAAEGEGGVRGDGTREELERIARETGVFIVVGLIEKVGGSLYCAVGYICPKLGFVGKRRKVQPGSRFVEVSQTGTERLIWAQGSPRTLKAVSTTIRGVRVNLAAAICWENYMPLLRQALYAQNVNLWLAPTADGRDAWLPLLRTIALEGRCFVVSSNMCVRQGASEAVGDGDELAGEDGVDEGGRPTGRRNSCLTEEGFEIALPQSPSSPAAAPTTSASAIADEEDHHRRGAEPEPEKPTPAVAARPKKGRQGRQWFVSRGGSAIVGPTGDVIAGPQWEDDAGIIYADVDFEDCIRGRLDLDAAGSYSRNDSFKFSVEGLDLDPLPY